MNLSFGQSAAMTPFVRVAIIVELGLAVLAFGIGLPLGIDPWNALEGNISGVLIGIAATLPMILLLLICDRDAFRPMKRIRGLLEQFLLPPLRGRPWWELALIAGAAGLGEETLFRGVMQEVLRDWLGFWPALAIASIVFGLLHALTPTYAIVATLIGAYLGLLFVMTGNLLVPIVAHGVYDLIALIYFLRTSPDDTISPSETTLMEDLP
ncbi:CPBP family intramembrane glutamic endopeptidase [Tautonia marina]|uniref:CPBP family intramembrane glutamic endopeptidase n=1 Tax=Tautonia marina TaxID=2653855 RepID=UPI001260D703|nr:CPBP family intramembrane glutamic endopeptidase [Tautonia marina]